MASNTVGLVLGAQQKALIPKGLLNRISLHEPTARQVAIELALFCGVANILVNFLKTIVFLVCAFKILKRLHPRKFFELAVKMRLIIIIAGICKAGHRCVPAQSVAVFNSLEADDPRKVFWWEAGDGFKPSFKLFNGQAGIVLH